MSGAEPGEVLPSLPVPSSQRREHGPSSGKATAARTGSRAVNLARREGGRELFCCCSTVTDLEKRERPSKAQPGAFPGSG